MTGQYVFSFPGVALVTGAGGTGIGAAVAKAFVQAGCTRIAITDINRAALEATKSAILEASPSATEPVVVLDRVGDVSDETFIDSFVQIAVESFSRIDYAVNCAGILDPRMTRSADTPVAAFERVNNVNYKGCWISARAVIRCMLKQGPLDADAPASAARGAIVNVASQLGLVGRSASAAYCGSKAAVINMTRADAIDYAGDGLRINCVCPGVVETPLTTSSDDVHRSMQEKALETPFGRMAKPHEIADSILFLCSSKASFIQGHALVVDGGYTIQ
ncbi:KR domain-containing protein [Aspergillus sp. HF37]|nr:KR domain-containing protein [Aspergillus sp. HF37]